MEFTIKKSSKDKVLELVEWIKGRAQDPLHENNKDLIADFLEQVVVVELKRLENDPDEFDTKVEIPDDLIPNQGPNPYVLIRKVVKALTEELTDDKGDPIDVDSILNIDIEEEDGDSDDKKPLTKGKVYTGSSSKGYNRDGNNHKKGKKNPLTDDQKTYITEKFLEKRGELDEKNCSEIAKHLGLSVNGKTPWQVTGWVSELHRKIAAGTLTFALAPVPSALITPQFVVNPMKKRLK